MCFYIYFDHDEGEACKIGRSAVLANGKCLYPFRLYDDDDELMFSGVSTEPNSFVPLDYTQDIYGTTRIDYCAEGEWTTL